MTVPAGTERSDAGSKHGDVRSKHRAYAAPRATGAKCSIICGDQRLQRPYVKEDAHAWDPTCTISYPSHRPLSACLVWATKEIEVLITHECFRQRYGSCHIEHYVATSAHQLYHCGRYAEANPKSIVVVDLDLLSHTDFHRVALLYTLPLAEALGANRKCAIMYFLDSYVRISTRCLASRRETKVLMQSALHSKTGGLECCICMQGTYCG